MMKRPIKKRAQCPIRGLGSQDRGDRIRAITSLCCCLPLIISYPMAGCQ